MPSARHCRRSIRARWPSTAILQRAARATCCAAASAASTRRETGGESVSTARSRWSPRSRPRPPPSSASRTAVMSSRWSRRPRSTSTPTDSSLTAPARGLTSAPKSRQAGCMDTPADAAQPASVDAVVDLLGAQDYLCDRRLATAILVAMRINKPLFLEGEAGVGKTEAARALAAGLGARLIRLQCYEGIDLAHAAYEWNYARQLLHIRLLGEDEDRF